MVLTTLVSLNSKQTAPTPTRMIGQRHRHKHNPKKSTMKTSWQLNVMSSLSLKLFLHSNKISRRKVSVSLVFLFITTEEAANAQGEGAFDFLRMTVPEQTVEQAEGGFRVHALRLLQVKQLLEMGSWKEAQKELRKSSAFLKQDFYTIIQAKPGIQRPALRELYSKLFNSVTRLDFAARDKDATRVWESYRNILLTLDDIFSRI